jgi:F-type H+-transporting ATPase subunit gamma
MPSIKELRQKIGSLKNTNKITSAMKLVSSSKLKKAQDAFTRNRAYFDGLNGVVQNLLRSTGGSASSLLSPRKEIRKIRVVLLSTDKGLCGSFNSSLLKFLQSKITKDWDGIHVEVVAVGKKGSDFFSRRFKPSALISEPGLPAKVPYSAAQKIGKECIADFLSKKVDAVYLVYNQFNSMVSQEPRLIDLLPIPIPAAKKGPILDYSFEPDSETIFEGLLPQLIQASIFRSMLSNALGEQAARMNAMENATKNSKDLIQRYTLIMNRARQSAITTELSEIVAGAESIKT